MAEKAIAERVAKQLGGRVKMVDGELQVMGANYKLICDMHDALLAAETARATLNDNCESGKTLLKEWYDRAVAAETKLEAERWRSVEKDGLPEGWVVVVIGGIVQHQMARYCGDDGWEWADPDADFAPPGEVVTHWKPIVPPSEDSK